MWGEIRPYTWSKGLEAVWIDNQSDADFEFRTDKEVITCLGRKQIRIDKSIKETLEYSNVFRNVHIFARIYF